MLNYKVIIELPHIGLYRIVFNWGNMLVVPFYLFRLRLTAYGTKE